MLNKPDKYRVCMWGDPASNEVIFGIQGRVAPRKWKHICQDGKPMFFDTRAKAEEAITILRK